MRLAFVLALALMLGAGPPKACRGPDHADSAARCGQLIAYYDRFGVGRSNNSDGRRNHTRIAAEIDCERGAYPRASRP